MKAEWSVSGAELPVRQTPQSGEFCPLAATPIPKAELSYSDERHHCHLAPMDEPLK
jgi:hypothetical protein